MTNYVTPKGRQFLSIAGNPVDIESRGLNMQHLADKMLDTLKFITDISDPQATYEADGKSMAKLAESASDLVDELTLAEQRYRPTGEAMADYGEQLEDTQVKIDTAISAAEASYQAYQLALEALATAQANESAYDLPNDPSDADRRDQQRLQGAASTAQDDVTLKEQAFQEDGEDYDAVFEHWETHEYEAALSRITQAIDGGLNDSWKDNFMGGLEVFIEVLKWVSLALAVLALFVGGPIIALAALIVSAVILVGTIILAFDGRKGLSDIIWAAVSVLPVAKLANGPKAFVKEIGGQWTKPISQIRNLARLKSLKGASKAGVEWSGAVANNFNSFKSGFTQFFTGGGGGFKNWAGGVFSRFTGAGSQHYTTSVDNMMNSSGPRFNEAVQSVLGKPFDVSIATGGERVIATGKSIFDWADRAVAWTQGRPSGGLK